MNNSHATDTAIFALSRDAIAICDDKKNIVQVNPAFEHSLGYKSEDIVNQNLFGLLTDDSKIRQEIEQELDDEREWVGDVNLNCQNKEIKKMTVCSSHDLQENTDKPKLFLIILGLSNERDKKENYYDKLTGLATPQLFIDRTEQALIAAPRSNKSVALLMVGLDRFVLINDGLGYHIGDQVLKAVADKLNQNIRRSDTAARIEGDRFALVMQITSIEDSVFVAEKILKSMCQTLEIEGNTLSLTASIGISIFPSDSSDQTSLIKHAESAMRYTKKLGGNHYQFFSAEMNTKAKKRIEMENKLRRAIKNNEFVVYYQPKVNLENNAIVGAEALVRWMDPDVGMVSPAEFIPIAEETGLVNGIGAIVLKEACRQNSEWQAKGLSGVKMSVNVAGSQFREPEFIDKVKAALTESGLAAEYLDLEITETMLIGNMEQVIEKLTAIREMGVHVSIDDFGTGYSSLSYLSRFPVTTLKIDQAFIRDMENDTATEEIVRAIIGLSHGLNLEVVAEGAENIKHINFLREQGCDLVQGYFYSKPLPAEEFEKKLAGEYLYDS
ncbi:MAG: EAL domain-containing protein [Methylococcaceae bacterium]|nr:EAL domain-containing protein [Methylococcaceae bacterium]